MELENTYLMWVGSESYSTIEEWIEEASNQGISKRLPNVNVGMALKKPGTIIFVAHDEGKWEDCPDCMGKIENPEWRKKYEKIGRFQEEISELRVEEKAVSALIKRSPGTSEEEYEKRKELDNVVRKIFRREEKIKELQEEIESMEETINGGTGGSVCLVKHGPANYVEEIVDYRKYNYWRHQPKKFEKFWGVIDDSNMCLNCGGKGELPVTQIFGLFIPSAIEYILKSEDDDDKIKNAVKDLFFRPVTNKELRLEMKRKCGKRKEGGYYVVADTECGESRANEVVEELVANGVVKPDGVEVKGNFVRFPSPVFVDGLKRFRGIKKWKIDEEGYINEETEMILDALE